MPVLFKSGNGPVASIINAFSAGGTSVTSLSSGATTGSLTVNAGGAYSGTPGTLQTIISHTGRGRVNVLNAYATNATARTIRVKITVDGTVVFDATSASVSASGAGMKIIGSLDSSAVVYQPIDYQESLLIEAASSVGSDAAANIAFGVVRETWAS